MDILNISQIYEFETNVFLDFSTFNCSPKNLTYLNISKNCFSNVEIIAKCYNLKHLNMSMCGLTTIKFLEELKHLEELDISFNEDIICETDYHILSNLTKLKKLNLAFGNMSDKSIIYKGKFIFEYLPQLEILNIRDNNIHSNSFVDKLPKSLKILGYRDNYFTIIKNHKSDILIDDSILIEKELI